MGLFLCRCFSLYGGTKYNAEVKFGALPSLERSYSNPFFVSLIFYDFENFNWPFINNYLQDFGFLTLLDFDVVQGTKFLGSRSKIAILIHNVRIHTFYHGNCFWI